MEHEFNPQIWGEGRLVEHLKAELSEGIYYLLIKAGEDQLAYAESTSREGVLVSLEATLAQFGRITDYVYIKRTADNWEHLDRVAAPYYIIRSSNNGERNEVIAKVSSETLGQMIVRVVPCADDQCVELFAANEFRLELQPGEVF